MRAVFIARGPRFPAGRALPTLRTIDVAPTIAELLGVPAPAHARGRSVFPLMEVVPARTP